MEITPDTIGNSLVALSISYIILFAFNIYVLYLNWKQSKVNDQMNELIKEVKGLRKDLAKK